MKKLSSEYFIKASKFIKEFSRPLEQEIYKNYFYKGNSEQVLNQLKKYQNKDGGFGNGLEPDFKLPLSSPMATTIAFQNLVKLDDDEKAIELIKLAINYLENAFVGKRNGWFSVSKEVNDFPHAPWWHFNEEEGMTIIDKYWGNPSAEIIAYLYKYKQFISKLDMELLLNHAVDYFNNLDNFESEHEVYCYIRLYQLLPYEVSSRIEEKLIFATKKLVCQNKEEWKKYVPQPLNFIDSPRALKFGISENLIEENLDYLVEAIENSGKMTPNWEWNSYELEWQKARKEWSGVLTLKALITLDKFNRIELS